MTGFFFFPPRVSYRQTLLLEDIIHQAHIISQISIDPLKKHTQTHTHTHSFTLSLPSHTHTHTQHEHTKGTKLPSISSDVVVRCQHLPQWNSVSPNLWFHVAKNHMTPLLSSPPLFLSPSFLGSH